MADEQIGKAQEIERAASRLESDMRDQIARMQNGTRVVLVVGIILIVVVFISLTKLTSMAKDEASPTTLADTVQSVARTEGIPALQKLLLARAPEVAETLRGQAVNQIPAVGRLLEDWTLSLADRLVDRVDVEVDGAISQMLASQQAELKPLIENASDPESAAELEAIFTASLEELVGHKMDELLVEFDRGMMLSLIHI